jgi:hypothetical protein
MVPAKMGSLSTRCAYKKYALMFKNLSKSQKVRLNIWFDGENHLLQNSYGIILQ